MAADDPTSDEIATPMFRRVARLSVTGSVSRSVPARVPHAVASSCAQESRTDGRGQATTGRA